MSLQKDNFDLYVVCPSCDSIYDTSWCYAFERFNGILGSYHTNNKVTEPQIMRRFCQHQIMYSEDTPFKELVTTVPYSYQQNDRTRTTCNFLCLLHYAIDSLDTIITFAWTDDMKAAVPPLPPYYEEILTIEAADQLYNIYKQLYPDRHLIQSRMSVNYHKFGQITIASDLVGSEMPGRNSISSSVIREYWPNRGDSLDAIDYSTMQVGTVQYFMQHKQLYTVAGSRKEDLHIFAYVKWKWLHTHYDWFGTSATICEHAPEYTYANFIPVQQIASRCAYAIMPVKFNDIVENVFIACGVSFKYCL